MNKNEKRSDGKMGMIARRLMFAAMAGLVAMSVAVSVQMRGCGREKDAGVVVKTHTPAPRPVAEVQKIDIGAIRRKYEAAVAAALTRYLGRVEELRKAFETELKKSGPARFDEARAAIPGIRKKFAKMGTMTAVVKDAVMDKVTDGDRLEHRLTEAVEEPFFGPCTQAAASLLEDGEAFRKALDHEFEVLCAELGEAGQKWPEAVPADFPAATMLKGMAQAECVLGAMPLKTAFVAAETALDAAAFKSILSGLRWLVLKMGGKAIAKGTATAAGPACDGPLPIGDIIAVGFAVWTVADIYELTQVLPKEIGKALEKSVQQTQKDTVTAVKNAAQRTAESYREAGKALAEKASAKGSGG